MTRRMTLAGAVFAIAVALPAGVSSGAARDATRVPVSQLVGQLLIGAYAGAQPSPAVLRRIAAGQLGGIIIRTPNVTSAAGVRAAVGELQRAARDGGRPPLLIAIDQEGGTVKRLRAGPPFASAAELGAAGGATAYRAGVATGRYLRALGVNVDFAPVLDVRARASFLGTRSFGSDPATVTGAAIPFAQGLESAGVAATAKHFPGLGTARWSTDDRDVTVAASRPILMRRLAPFAAAVESRVPLVMVSSARYPALDRTRLPALLSPTIVNGLLRRQLGFGGVVVTDTMGARAVVPFPLAPLRAVRAGVDVLLYSASEDDSAEAYHLLVRAVRSGSLDRRVVERSYRRVLRLKASVS